VFISTETIEKNKPEPLSRPLFVYVNIKNTQENPTLKNFVKFYLKQIPELAI
jgi:phosphate transport system substrate-binding protein